MLKVRRASIALGDYGEHLISFTLSSPGKDFLRGSQISFQIIHFCIPPISSVYLERIMSVYVGTVWD